ncbi:hypothetical protein DPMN_094291 [Dreissena polymorpha]|uniref:Uncharacterized protein n=1 Tax=Dreissena polymorpha TaxID=45954 RepID=A0A9D4R3E6_DREPO|nr:hypothetical protein DPMN_094291 [Dreissena polymorpha]
MVTTSPRFVLPVHVSTSANCERWLGKIQFRVQSATLQQTAPWKQLWSVCIDDCQMFGHENASHNVATGP